MNRPTPTDIIRRLREASLSNADMQTIFDAGVEAGSKAEEERRTPNYFRDVAATNPERRFFYEREPGFPEGIVAQTADGDVPSEAQQVWLLKIYRRLGGRNYDAARAAPRF